MTYIVELRYIGGELAELMREMRAWLDHNEVETEEFYHSSGPPGLAFRVGFRDQHDASAFAEAFCGWLECADPYGAGARWTIPPSRQSTSMSSKPSSA